MQTPCVKWVVFNLKTHIGRKHCLQKFNWTQRYMFDPVMLSALFWNRLSLCLFSVANHDLWFLEFIDTQFDEECEI